MGMFCRFGSLLLKRPVAATAWLKQVCTRPVSGLTSCGKRVDVGALQLLQRRATRESAAADRATSASSSRTSTAVDAVLVLRVALQARAAAACRTGSRDSCFGELMLNSSPGQLEDLRAAGGQLAIDVLRLRRPVPARRCGRRRVRSRPAPGSAAARASRRRLELLASQQIAAACPPAAARDRPARRRNRAPVCRRHPRTRSSWRRARTRPLRAAPCSPRARARGPRAGAPSASHRAGSSRASMSVSMPRSVTPCRARTIASNLRSCPIFAICGIFEQRLQRRQRIEHVETIFRGAAGARAEEIRRRSCAPRAERSAPVARAVENAMPAIPARIAAGASGSTRNPKRPARLQLPDELRAVPQAVGRRA